MDDAYFRKIMTTVILVALLLLTFLLIKPILLSIILGILLAFIFNPIYNWLFKKTSSKNLSATLCTLFLLLAIVIPFWFLVPVILGQAFKIYVVVQQTDFVTPLKNLFSSLFPTEELSTEIGTIIHSFVIKVANSIVNSLSQFILNFPSLFLQLMVSFFTFYFVLRDKKQLVGYLQSLSPFSKDVEKKLFESSKGITSSVLYGQVVVGFIQGIVSGVGFFLAGVPNALTFTLLSCLVGILPIIGTLLVWLPIMIYLFVAGETFGAIIVLIFGLISSNIDNFLRPMIVSRRTNIPPSIIIIGMIGGVFFFGILGLILGPLILAYLLIVLELYRHKGKPKLL